MGLLANALNKNNLAHILLVEDNPGDVTLVKQALATCPQAVALTVARDGEEAIQLLHKQAPYANLPVPDLILLDLNLPKVDGHAVLKSIKQDEHLRKIPVVVLTTSSAPSDVNHAYALHANSFVVKAHDLDNFFTQVCGIVAYWFETAALPRWNVASSKREQ